MKKWIQENPWLAVGAVAVFSALFLAGPIALIIVKVKELVTGKKLPAGASNPADQVAAHTNK